MSTSRKQRAANRRNAKKSTGPRSPEGKARSSKNAITHGITATDIIINTRYYKEDRREYDILVASIRDELQPQGVLQDHLVVKIANCLWRHQRVIKAETARIEDHIARGIDIAETASKFRGMLSSDEDREDEDLDLEGVAQSRAVLEEKYRGSLMQYEVRLDHQLNRTYKMLRQLQDQAAARRKGEKENERRNGHRGQSGNPTPEGWATKGVPRREDGPLPSQGRRAEDCRSQSHCPAPCEPDNDCRAGLPETCHDADASAPTGGDDRDENPRWLPDWAKTQNEPNSDQALASLEAVRSIYDEDCG